MDWLGKLRIKANYLSQVPIAIAINISNYCSTPNLQMPFAGLLRLFANFKMLCFTASQAEHVL